MTFNDWIVKSLHLLLALHKYPKNIDSIRLSDNGEDKVGLKKLLEDFVRLCPGKLHAERIAEL